MVFLGYLIPRRRRHSNGELETNPVSQQGWRPSYLRRRVLLIFIITFCGMIGTLEGLAQVAKAHAGLASSVESLHYSWTYGPTAILTIVAALWGRVEFQAKQNTPWQQMLGDSSSEASKSILLDYISVMQPVAVFKAFRNRHYLVAASVSSSLILRLLIIVSTGLFSLQPTPVVIGHVPVQLSTSFDTFNASTRLEAAKFKAFDVLNAIVYKGNSYAEGTNSKVAFQGVSPSGLPANALINTTVQAIAADLECESAGFNSENFTKFGEGTLLTPSCNLTLSFNEVWNNDDLRIVSQVAPPHMCSNSKDENDKRVAIFIGEMYLLKNLTGHSSSNSLLNISVGNSKQYVCKPTYSLRKHAAILNTTSESFSTTLLGEVKTASTLRNVTALDIASQAFTYSDTYLRASEPANSDTLFTARNLSMDIAIKIGARLSGFKGSAQDIYDQNKAGDLFKAFYRAVTAQVVNQALLQPQKSETAGHAVVTEDRLLITVVSLRAMEVCFILLTILAIVMSVLIPSQTQVPWNPNKITAIANVLASNPTLRESFQGTGSASQSSLASHLAGKRYTMQSLDGSLSIETEDNRKSDKIAFSSEEVVNWRPFPNFPTRFTFYIILAGIIASLEAVLRVSQARNGLGKVSNSTYTHYLWTLLPALVMVSINLLFGSIDFNTRSLAPYARLKKNLGVDFRYISTWNFMDSLSPMTIYNSIKLKDFAVLITTITAILGSVLTIVSSGLYSPINTTATSPINFTQTTMPMSPHVLSTEVSSNSSNGVSGMQTASEILNDNLTYPQWTWGEFSFPNMTFNPKFLTPNTTGMFVDLVVPALRSSLDCQLRNSSQLATNFTPMPALSTSPWAGPTLLVNSTILPCSKSQKTTSLRTQIKGAAQNRAVEGKYLPTGSFGSTTGTSCYLNGTSMQAIFNSNPAVDFNQNQVSYIWGETTASSLVNLMELACMDSPERVQTKVRFKLPDMIIDEDHPPTAIEKTATRAHDAFFPLSFNWYYLQSYDQSATGLDAFFQALVSGKHSIPEGYLSDPGKVEEVVQAIKYQHKIIKAQQISQNAQTVANRSMDRSPILGNITNPSHLRLFQDAASTRALEGLIAALLLLGILSSVILDTDKVLPKNPNSIAAVASLLADSNFLGCLSRGTRPTDDSFDTTVFADSRFHLGWFHGEGFPVPGFPQGTHESPRGEAKSNNPKLTIYVDSYEGKPI